MPCHVHHPFSFLNLFAVLGMLFHVTALSDHAQLNQQLEPSSVRHYIEQLHAEKTLNNTALVSKFYREHDFQPFWTGTYAAHSRADELIHVLRTAHLEGLVKPGHYASAIEAQQKLPDEKDRAWLDVLLTDAFLDYAQQAGRGQLDPRSLKEKWRYPLPKVNALSVLEKAFLSNNVEAVLRDLSPQYASYRRLVEARAFYIAIKERGGWPQFAIYGPSLELDTQSEEILLLRKRLQITGDLPANASQLANFGYELQEAVKRFQVRHGLDADGVVGQTTRYALHAPVEKRIQQITANLERWRWLPRD
ncbi:MAG: peptidoglycan-binding protein, partial [Gammaproteobacteria bacterium]